MTPPTVLCLSNDTEYGPKENFGPAFAALEAEGVLRHRRIATLAELAGAGREQALRTMRQFAAETRPDLILVLSPGGFPWQDEDVASLLRTCADPPVILWEGDPWGGRKPVLPGTKPWLRRADTVFTVGLGVQAELLDTFTRRPVRYIAQTVPQRLWDDSPVPEPVSAKYDVMHIGGCFVRFKVLERIDGARQRLRLVSALQKLDNCRFAVHGSGWKGPGALGPVPFDDQLKALRTARISANWDHFPGRDGYCSNRLPLSLFAGRPHVTTRPLHTPWLPGPEQGLHLVDTVREAVDRVAELLRADPETLHTAGVAGHDWVRTRLTEVNALRFMLGDHLPLAPPPADPWEAIAAMDRPVSGRPSFATAPV